ncbi:hypothetical protein ASPZODRAFT_135825 [Penicilliopsis zonata CBS 506.65]|uniref:Mediator of RNA polymerase II transcription subunit 6 n=1 Tax=Penicilliopsis zonata CBS 506.65 TaxID=1073090 RepID=A0A1L9S9G3_9EURO|nr:hypothetical protein ASPZODRAFT_135825 [Penicilliopsis zonata CBS 506.65]OJJ43800.1 hypothetical protein ASPZODRAFT_135825 [Penicilliopsis zonata CBS 506.65]
MATAQDASLEEILWRSPPHVQMMGGYLHSNNILFYFAESPFFDATSNNASLAIQANYNEAFRHFVETRDAFEGRLKTMQGVEFVVAYDPLQAAAQPDGSFAHEPSNIWVIRKQNRRKRTGFDDEVQVLATFFVVGDCIYMAPSVASVVGNRILSAVTSLTKMMKTAATLPTFTPSYGHTYMPPASRSTDLNQPAGAQSQLSKENTPLPDADTQAKAPLVGGGSAGQTSSTLQDTRALAEAFQLFARYGDEFMDENPLVGEPGSFVMSKSGEASASGAGASAGAASKPSATLNPPPAKGTPSVGTPSVRVDSSMLTPTAMEKPSTPSGTDDNKLKKKRSTIGI